jgi:hypothetical protein
VTLSQPRSGALCISGSVKPDGYALLGLVLAVKNQDGTKTVQPFDAAARGIARVTLAIDSPPSHGVALAAHMVTRLEGPANRLDCFYAPDFKFGDVTVPGTVTAPLRLQVRRRSELRPRRDDARTTCSSKCNWGATPSASTTFIF